MNINNYYHAYLAALQLHLEEIPEELTIYSPEVHRAWMNAKLYELVSLFHTARMPKPGFGLSHTDAIRKLIWNMSIAKFPLRLAQNEYFSLCLSHTPALPHSAPPTANPMSQNFATNLQISQ